MLKFERCERQGKQSGGATAYPSSRKEIQMIPNESSYVSCDNWRGLEASKWIMLEGMPNNDVPLS